MQHTENKIMHFLRWQLAKGITQLSPVFWVKFHHTHSFYVCVCSTVYCGPTNAMQFQMTLTP